MSFTLVQGSLMAAALAVSTGACAPGGCDGCGGDDGDTEVGTCLSVCGSSAHGLLPDQPLAPPSALRAGFHTAPSVFAGRINTPDHGPPKILTLG
jgi:hypothetical protein